MSALFNASWAVSVITSTRRHAICASCWRCNGESELSEPNTRKTTSPDARRTKENTMQPKTTIILIAAVATVIVTTALMIAIWR